MTFAKQLAIKYMRLWFWIVVVLGLYMWGLYYLTKVLINIITK